jgi:hypothetical protein
MPAPNRHITNRRIFKEVDALDPLLQLYCKLVALELSLKDFNANNITLSHDVYAMTLSTFQTNSSIAAAAATLNGDLATLSCSDRRGRPANVQATKYPDLRYVRMNTDFDPPSSTDAEIRRALNSLNALINELLKEGLPWP